MIAVKMPTAVKTFRAGIWNRLRYQLAGALLFAALGPYLMRVLTLSHAESIGQLNQTLLVSASAIILGGWLYRSVSTYPGIEASSYILPCFSLSFAMMMMVFVFGRLDYNRAVFLSGYLGSIAWFYIVYFKTQRQQRLRIGLISFGAVNVLRELDRIHWVTLQTPEADVTRLDAIATDLRIDLPNEWERKLADYALAGIPVYHFKHLRESLTGRVDVEHLSENSFGSLTPASAYMSLKHSVDWMVAALVAILTLPFLLVVCVAIRLDSPGPAIFSQRRVGYRGRPFTVYKFRTMTVAEAEAEDARISAMTQHGDSRVTKLGRFLRKLRIDELPQVFNILKGEMSWIGPRPEAEVLSRWYETEIPFYRYRHIVRPGITGWAQVSQGHVTEVTEVKSKLDYDFYYIKSFSPWIDLLIVARTVRTMLTGFGSR